MHPSFLVLTKLLAVGRGRPDSANGEMNDPGHQGEQTLIRSALLSKSTTLNDNPVEIWPPMLLQG